MQRGPRSTRFARGCHSILTLINTPQALGEDVDTFFKVENADGSKFKNYVANVDSACTDLQAGIGEVVAGTEILININAGIWVRLPNSAFSARSLSFALQKRVDQRDSVTKDLMVAEGNKDKDSKNKQKYDEAKQKFDEVNSKLKNDMKETLTAGHPKFRTHFDKVAYTQPVLGNATSPVGLHAPAAHRGPEARLQGHGRRRRPRRLSAVLHLSMRGRRHCVATRWVPLGNLGKKIQSPNPCSRHRGVRGRKSSSLPFLRNRVRRWRSSSVGASRSAMPNMSAACRAT